MSHNKILYNAVIVDQIIQGRKTAKILRDPKQCETLAPDTSMYMRETLKELVAVAGWAPFHKVANEQEHRQGLMKSIVPWRFYVLEKPTCCRLIQYIEIQAHNNNDPKWSKAWESKIPKLLAGCSALIQVTWLPDPSESDNPELTTNNIEHIAAASAAVQNLLLASQARNLHNYWSSGGILKDQDIFDRLGIPRNQKLLGAIFITHPDQAYDNNQGGGLRDKRGEMNDWTTWVSLDE